MHLKATVLVKSRNLGSWGLLEQNRLTVIATWWKNLAFPLIYGVVMSELMFSYFLNQLDADFLNL